MDHPKSLDHRKEGRLDKTIDDSFPASDPPSHTGITGVRDQKKKGDQAAKKRPPSHERDNDARPTGQPTSDRHATETAYSWEDDDKSSADRNN